ncbi:MAG: hypothetical protein ACLPPV_12940 [Candidatus Korobacteraceae bacterium]
MAPEETVAEAGEMVMATLDEELLFCVPPPQATIERSRQVEIERVSNAVEYRRIGASEWIVTSVAVVDELKTRRVGSERRDNTIHIVSCGSYEATEKCSGALCEGASPGEAAAIKLNK